MDAAPRLYIEFLDANQARTSINAVSADYGTVNVWQRVAVTASAPANTVYVRVLCPYIDVQESRTVLAYYDAVQLEHKPYATTYCDGDQGYGYGWNDDQEPHNSASTRASTLIAVPSSGVISGPAGSVSVWWQPGHASSVDYHRYLFDLRDGTTDWGYLYWDYEYDSYSFSGLRSNDQHFSAGEWQHVVVTWETGSRAIYVNGNPENADSTSPRTSIPDTLHVGVQYSGMFYANGPVAEFATFDHALTASEVTALFRMGVSSIVGQ